MSIVKEVLNERKGEIKARLKSVNAELARYEEAVVFSLRHRDSLDEQLAEIETALKGVA